MAVLLTFVVLSAYLKFAFGAAAIVAESTVIDKDKANVTYKTVSAFEGRNASEALAWATKVINSVLPSITETGGAICIRRCPNKSIEDSLCVKGVEVCTHSDNKNCSCSGGSACASATTTAEPVTTTQCTTTCSPEVVKPCVDNGPNNEENDCKGDVSEGENVCDGGNVNGGNVNGGNVNGGNVNGGEDNQTTPPTSSNTECQAQQPCPSVQYYPECHGWRAPYNPYYGYPQNCPPGCYGGQPVHMPWPNWIAPC